MAGGPALRTPRTVIVGAGVKDTGGTALVYKADSLRSGAWTYVGELCRGEGDTGVIWECPVLLQLPRLAAAPPPCRIAAAKPPPPSLPALEAPLSTRRVPSSPVPFTLTAAASASTQLLSAALAPDAASLLLPPLPQPGGSVPGSPRPPIRLLGRSTAAAAGVVSVVGAGETPWTGAEYGDRALAAVLSPRRPCGLPMPAPLQLRWPLRWQLPPLHALPHAPSPPVPRPPGLRHVATASGPLSPYGRAGAAARQLRSPPAASRPQPRQYAAAPVAPSQSLPALQLLSTTSQELPPPHTPTPASTAEATVLAAAPWHAAPAASPAPASAPSWQRYQTFFCVCPDDCNSMAVYYLGAFDPAATAFDLASALGPFDLDLGDVFYAANTLTDPQGRAVLWGWVQEKPRRVGAYDYAGCLSLPRLLFLEVDEDRPAGGSPGAHLVQRPPPELAALRVPGSEWLASGVLLDSGGTAPVQLPASAAHHLELALAVRVAGEGEGEAAPGDLLAACPVGGVQVEGSACTFACACNSCSGVLLHSWSGGPEGAAALLYHWDSGVLEVVFEAMDPTTLTFSLAAPGARRVGGPLLRPPAPGSPLELRVFLDYSCLEVFTAGGEVLTARVYRGCPAAQHPDRQQYSEPGGPAGVELVSFGCCSEFVSVAAYEVGGIWVDEV